MNQKTLVFTMVFSLLFLGAGCAQTEEVVMVDKLVEESFVADKPVENFKSETETVSAQTAMVEIGDWSGQWDYEGDTGDGYSSSITLDIDANETDFSANFMAVWNFPNGPAARLNTGSLSMVSTSQNMISLFWEGIRDDSGTAVLTLSKDKKTLTWNGTMSPNIIDDGYSLNRTMVFKRTK